MAKDNDTPELLTLGWTVDSAHEPKYWTKHTGANRPAPAEADLVAVPAPSLAAHTVIVAQSGSGKSFFLGRLIEELLIHTKARCVIFDPNADFRKIHKVKDQKLWTEPTYKSGEKNPGLPHELQMSEFAEPWSRLTMRIRKGPGQRPGSTPVVSPPSAGIYEQLLLWWTTLPVAALSEDLDPSLRSDIYHCHEFVRALAEIFHLRSKPADSATNVVEEAERIFEMARRHNPRRYLIREYPLPIEPQPGAAGAAPAVSPAPEAEDEGAKRQRFLERASSIAKYVTPEAQRFYFARAKQYITERIAEPSAPPKDRADPPRLEVIDLPSIRIQQTKLLAISSIISDVKRQAMKEWDKALEQDEKDEDLRVPTFIVVDEAHNYMSESPQGETARSLRDQFRNIAAEGRKYGLFLIAVSQRPDKLDPMIVSECENRAVMRIGSSGLLDVTKRLLGLDDVPPDLLEECLGLERGLALIAGQWSEGARLLYTAARRTEEGGRDLDKKYWAKPPKVSVPAPATA